MLTTVRGSVLSLDSSDEASPLNIVLQSFNHHWWENFDFSGTGLTTGDDADPLDYEINTGQLDLSSLTPGDPVMLRGFVQPFAQAPQDFNAQTLVSLSNTYAFLNVHWLPASDQALEEITAQGLTLNLDESQVSLGWMHHVFRAWVVTDLTSLSSSPVVTSQDSGSGLFFLRIGWRVQLFRSFDDFSTELTRQVTDGRTVRKIRARGHFDDATANFTADRIDISLR
jgi:hypothetical protein